MTDKQRIDDLETKISTLEAGLKGKADKSGSISVGQVRTGVLKTDPANSSELATTSYVNEKTKPAAVLKTIQDADLLGGSKFSVASLAMGSAFSIGLGSLIAATLPSIFSTSDIITKWLENKFHVVRRNNGLLWRESEEQRNRRLSQERARDNFGALSDGTRRLTAIVSQLRRKVNGLETRITRTNSNLGDTDSRLAAVRTEVRDLSRRSTHIQNRARGAASVATAGGTADELQVLRRQVDILVASLG